jgi:hypothetical protein
MGLPNLFMRRLSHGEYTKCLAEFETFDGKKRLGLDYAVACVVACVDEAGKPYFTKDDLASLQLLDKVGIEPFAAAFNAANGMNDDPKATGPGENEAVA